MANFNIYDLHISELLLRLNATSVNNTAPALIVTNNRGTNQVAENFNSVINFMSTVINIPVGYSISGTTHTLDYPTATPDTSGGAATITGSDTVILGAIGSTYTVTATVTLIHATDPPILLTTAHVLTAVSPIYFGVKAFSGTPNSVGLLTIAETDRIFQMTNSIVGRIYVVIPSTQASLVSLTGPNGMIIPVSDFNLITVGTLNYYQLNYDTQLTGVNLKTFTINYI